jgi:hypothetical protein
MTPRVTQWADECRIEIPHRSKRRELFLKELTLIKA